MKRSTEEAFLLLLLQAAAGDRNKQAILLQEYIATRGPLTEETGTKVREILGKSK